MVGKIWFDFVPKYYHRRDGQTPEIFHKILRQKLCSTTLNQTDSWWITETNEKADELQNSTNSLESLDVYGGKDLIRLRTKILNFVYKIQDFPWNSPAKIVLYHVEPNRQLVNNRNERESWRASKFNKQSDNLWTQLEVWWERFDSYQNTVRDMTVKCHLSSVKNSFCKAVKHYIIFQPKLHMCSTAQLPYFGVHSTCSCWGYFTMRHKGQKLHL